MSSSSSSSPTTRAAKKAKTTTTKNDGGDNNRNKNIVGVYRYAPQALAASFAELTNTDNNAGGEQLRESYLQGTLDGSVDTTTTNGPPDPPQTKNDNADDSSVVVAAVQLTGAGLPSSSILGYCLRAERAIAKAVTEHGAQIVLLPELWSGPYFCQTQQACLQSLALPIGNDDKNDDNQNDNILLQRMQHLAQHYQVVLPLSLYERAHNTLFNSLVMIDSDGTIVGTTPYRKSHIPDGPGYQEKFYFSPGDSAGAGGVFDVTPRRRRHVGHNGHHPHNSLRLGVAICWDQWFPETARSLALQGCEVLLYPTAIGSEPQDVTLDSSAHWQRVMQGHAAANMIPVVAANRFGTEVLMMEDDDDDDDEKEDDNDTTTNKTKEDGPKERQRIHFYGKSFITDPTGAIVAEAKDTTTTIGLMDDDDTPTRESTGDAGQPSPQPHDENDAAAVGIISSTLYPRRQRDERLAWGLFRDRRPDLYQPLLTKDGGGRKG